MFQIAAFTVFALLVARVVGAPKGTWRYVLGAAVAALLASQLLPAGNAFRADVAGSARTFFWIGLGLIPVAAYVLVVRRLRRRLGSDAAFEAPRRQGIVQFAEDAALAADTVAALEREPGAGDPVSLGWRTEDGALVGHLRLRVRADAAEVELLLVAAEQRRKGVGAALLRAAEGEAAARGALRLGALAPDGAAEAFFARAGYAAAAAHGIGGGRTRRWMERAL